MLAILIIVGAVMFTVFRWKLFSKAIGLRGMFLFDAVYFIACAAFFLTRTGPYNWIEYLIGTMCVFMSVTSMVCYIKLGNLIRKAVALEQKNRNTNG